MGEGGEKKKTLVSDAKIQPPSPPWLLDSPHTQGILPAPRGRPHPDNWVRKQFTGWSPLRLPSVLFWVVAGRKGVSAPIGDLHGVSNVSPLALTT